MSFHEFKTWIRPIDELKMESKIEEIPTEKLSCNAELDNRNLKISHIRYECQKLG
jgi:hypothetical protein